MTNSHSTRGDGDTTHAGDLQPEALRRMRNTSDRSGSVEWRGVAAPCTLPGARLPPNARRSSPSHRSST